MNNDLSLEEFLVRNRIDISDWNQANIEWPVLLEIASDHDAMQVHLENSAEFFAKVIQKFAGVHSVRWRVKDSEHLLAKIVRKRSEGNEKYKDITHENYFERITDLVGIRALHLFKEDCFGIDAALRSVWTPIEIPVAYIREGDSEGLKEKFKKENFDVKNHPAGYRSVHYVIKSTPLKRPIFAELQVRTIFEEGWSEIDHKVRYPNFSDNDLVEYFLEIFNRMAGSADDMGGFVLGLVATLSHLEEKIVVINKEKEATLQEMEQALNQLESVKQDNVSRESLALLKKEVAKLKEDNQIRGGLARYQASVTDEAHLGLPSSKLNDLLKGSAAEQAHLGLSAAKLHELSKFSAAKQVLGGLPSSKLNDLLKGSAAEQALLGLSAAKLHELSKFSAAEQALLGLSSSKLSDILKTKLKGSG